MNVVASAAMLDFPALDVAIGLIFLYIILALVCSTVNETISTGFGLRARFLRDGILNLLSGAGDITDDGRKTAKEFYTHPLVQGLIRPGHGPEIEERRQRWWHKPPYPSYLPSRTFVAALTDMARQAKDTLEKDRKEGAKPAKEGIEDAKEALEESLKALPNARLSEALLALYRTADRDAARFQHAAEQWFDDSMERVSGWYKRRVQLILVFITAVVVLALNADTLGAGRVLWRDDAARAAIVKKAEAAAAKPDEVDVDNAVNQLDIPLGWKLSFGDEPTQVPNDVLAWFAKFLGLALTIGAVMLGAPFWFDLLSKVMRVRSTGAPPPASDAIREPKAVPDGPVVVVQGAAQPVAGVAPDPDRG